MKALLCAACHSFPCICGARDYPEQVAFTNAMFYEIAESRAKLLIERTQLQKRAAQLQKQVAQLQTTVNKLPKTGDDVSIVPGMLVYGRLLDRIKIERFIVMKVGEETITSTDIKGDIFTACASRFYSTYKAAKAAKGNG